MGRLDGKRVIITGSARGMGAEHVRKFVAEGASVVIADILDEQGEQLAAELGENVRYVHLDVASQEDWNQAIATCTSTFGGLDVLVNNAGIGFIKSIDETTLDEWNQTLAVNLTGQFIGLKSALPELRKSDCASVINVSSIGGLTGLSMQIPYVASKFGVRGFTKATAAELGPEGIRVNSVHPGIVDTEMTGNPAEWYQLKDVPLRRVGKPEEITGMVVFLASDEASFISGGEFVVDGGESSSSYAFDFRA